MHISKKRERKKRRNKTLIEEPKDDAFGSRCERYEGATTIYEGAIGKKERDYF